MLSTIVHEVAVIVVPAKKIYFLLQENFSTFEYALLKTFAMTLGELNYESDFIPDVKLHYPLAANAVFVFFCLAMPIILMNMLVNIFIVLIFSFGGKLPGI